MSAAELPHGQCGTDLHVFPEPPNSLCSQGFHLPPAPCQGAQQPAQRRGGWCLIHHISISYLEIQFLPHQKVVMPSEIVDVLQKGVGGEKLSWKMENFTIWGLCLEQKSTENTFFFTKKLAWNINVFFWSLQGACKRSCFSPQLNPEQPHPSSKPRAPRKAVLEEVGAAKFHWSSSWSWGELQDPGKKQSSKPSAALVSFPQSKSSLNNAALLGPSRSWWGQRRLRSQTHPEPTQKHWAAIPTAIPAQGTAQLPEQEQLHTCSSCSALQPSPFFQSFLCSS